MNISTKNNDILINNKIIFSRKYPNFNIPDVITKNDNLIENNNEIINNESVEQSTEEEYYNRSEDFFEQLDDETIEIINRYERIHGDQIGLQIILGQFDINSLNKIVNDYYKELDEEDEYFYGEDY